MATDSTSASRAPARPSSSRSDAWLQAMLDVEAALARATAPEHAEAIAAACRAERFDAEAIAAEGERHASPVVPLVAALREAVGPEHAEFVHLGATSQDIVDTAAMLLARRAIDALSIDACAAADAAARLAAEHRDTPMIARTLLQQALPTTFGLKAAGWAVGIDGAIARLDAQPLWVQMGGPVGARDPAVAAAVAAELVLEVPTLPWHADRVGPASLAAALGVLCGALGKVATDVVLLAQGEVGEVRSGDGASSAMAHKRNPADAVAVRAAATRAPGLVATMLAAQGSAEHERAAGAWQAEWAALGDLLDVTEGAAAHARRMLETLEVVPERMAANLARVGGAPDLDATGALIDRALATHERQETP
ncbi:MAG: lyase family protein [Solirubrobacteraceae bacterium]